MTSPHLLVVDDDAGHRIMLQTLINKWGFQVSCAEDGAAAVSMVKEHPFDLVLMDVRMAPMDGITALKAIKHHNPAVPVVIMTAYSAVESAVEALKSGAYDYLIKPLDFDVLKLTLQRTLEHSVTDSGLLSGHGQFSVTPSLFSGEDSPALGGIVGTSPAIRALQDMIRLTAPSEATVLITGRSGTGKELVARAIHALSSRASKPWVVVNCAALSENLLESELFGHEKGAFTGADRLRDGRFMQADGGTLFLDEIGEIPLGMQAKLLRAIQQREIQRVGSDRTLNVNVRLVAATNRDLTDEIQAGRFREDLYYRLNVMTLYVPSLEERREDIPLLAQHFLRQHAERNHKNVKGFTPLAMDMLRSYDWPGNVRELENTLERAVVLLFGSYVSDRELPPTITKAYQSGNTTAADATATPPLQPSETATIDDMKRALIIQTLESTGNNKSEAAKRLGISRKTLHQKLKQYEQGDEDPAV